MLIALTLLTVLFYACLIRPTANARRFVAAIERGDYQAADAMCLGDDGHFVSTADASVSEPITVTAIIEPWSWRNVWKMKRLIEVRMIGDTEVKIYAGQHIRSGIYFRAVAGVLGIRHTDKQQRLMKAEPHESQ
jgi:hypothetical protein